jgi:dipeptidyl aminopeptidase/acylaminoacyl peptidase
MSVKIRLTLVSVLLFVLLICLEGQGKRIPSFEEVLSLQSVYAPRISPDGNSVVFAKTAVDWKENKTDSELWIAKKGEEPFQLTNNPKGGCSNPKWSPDGKWIAFIKAAPDKNQIHVIHPYGGESFQVSDAKNGVNDYEWSPDGKRFAFLQSQDKEKEDKERKEKFGGYAVEDAEYSLDQLWILDFRPDSLAVMLLPDQLKDTTRLKKEGTRLLPDSLKFTITGFMWSPDGSKIAFTHRPDPSFEYFYKEDISILDVNTGKQQLLVSNPSSDNLIDWSPDSRSILYATYLEDSTSNYYKNNKLFRIDIEGSKNKQLAPDFDEELYNLKWIGSGIIGNVWQKTRRPFIEIDPESGNFTLIGVNPSRVYDFTVSDDGKRIAFQGSDDDGLGEIYTADLPLGNISRITENSDQIKDWLTARNEVISWKSKDGELIEGILFKPQDYDENRKYPLLVIIHGGPTGTSVPQPVPAYVYPVVQWLNKGALVLMPNYRGSAGYGERFRSLNVRNLGVGDAWDVMSGVQYLVARGVVDKDRMGAMGWSEGGYISAFLTTNTDKFRAISVGAGISDWMTYYVNTDIHPFTRQYLKATPWSDKAIYEKTSPITSINKAKTPTLIQHGEFDKRVPPANAFELYQGLKDVGVETKLVIYKGFGHGISKPKEQLAAMWHNWQWFGKYIWDEQIDLPVK